VTPLDAFAQVALRTNTQHLEPIHAYRRIASNTVIHLASTDADAPAPQIENFSVQGNNNYVFSGYRSAIKRTISVNINGSNNIIYIGPFCEVNKFDVDIFGGNNVIHIGAFSTSGGLSMSISGSHNEYIIGPHCMLAGRVTFGYRQKLYRNPDGILVSTGNIRLAQHVWVAREACLFGETSIGENSIIGQVSSVRGDFPANAIISGQPAKLIRTGITWGRRIDDSLIEMERSSHYMQTRVRPMAILSARIAGLMSG
jgi:acetyltransferase-like isoleucine patch superfamily enzyme